MIILKAIAQSVLSWISQILEIFDPTTTSEWKILLDSDAFILLPIAFLCGALIGTERELVHKPAGIRTNALICMGSALFTLASVLSWTYIGNQSPTIDPARIAAQIVTGIGFIGAGAILVSKGKITGLTSAAAIWLSAASGIVIGFVLHIRCGIYFYSKLYFTHT